MSDLPPAVSRSPMRGRMIGFDYLRLGAAFMVVWTHASDTNVHASWVRINICSPLAMPCFFMLSALLLAEGLLRRPDEGFLVFAERRARRLLPAYLFWTVVYLGLRLAKHTLVSKEPLRGVGWFDIVFAGGASYQLWYIPTLFYLSLAFYPVLLGLAKRKPAAVVVVGLALAAVVSLWPQNPTSPYEWLRVVLQVPFHWANLMGLGNRVYLMCGIPYFLLGLACWSYARAANRLSGAKVPGKAIFWGAMACLGAACCLIGKALWGPPLLAALVLGATGLKLEPAGRSMQWLADQSFGIFLCHAVFIEGLQVLAGLVHFDISSLPATLSIIISSFIASALLAWSVSRFRVLRWTVA